MMMYFKNLVLLSIIEKIEISINEYEIVLNSSIKAELSNNGKTYTKLTILSNSIKLFGILLKNKIIIYSFE